MSELTNSTSKNVRLGLVQVSVDQVVVQVEEAQSDLVEDQVEAMAQRDCLLIGLSELLQRSFLRPQTSHLAHERAFILKDGFVDSPYRR